LVWPAGYLEEDSLYVFLQQCKRKLSSCGSENGAAGQRPPLLLWPDPGCTQLKISSHSFPASAECNEWKITTHALGKTLEEESLKLIEDGPFLRVVPK
jgi:hypothetical protein